MLFFNAEDSGKLDVLVENLYFILQIPVNPVFKEKDIKFPLYLPVKF